MIRLCRFWNDTKLERSGLEPEQKPFRGAFRLLLNTHTHTGLWGGTDGLAPRSQPWLLPGSFLRANRHQRFHLLRRLVKELFSDV